MLFKYCYYVFSRLFFTFGYWVLGRVTVLWTPTVRFSFHLLHHPGLYRQVRAVNTFKGSFNAWLSGHTLHNSTCIFPFRSPIQVITRPNVAWLQCSNGNWYLLLFIFCHYILLNVCIFIYPLLVFVHQCFTLSSFCLFSNIKIATNDHSSQKWNLKLSFDVIYQ